MQKKLLFGATAAGIAVGLVVVADNEALRHMKTVTKASYRIGNLVGTAAVMAIDYKFCSETAAIEQISGTLNTLKKEFDSKQRSQEVNVREFHVLKARGDNVQEIQQKLDDTRARINFVAEQIALIEEKTDQTMSGVHKRNARRLLSMCAKNEGVYIKLGQHLAMLDYVVPKEYQEELLTLLDNTPRSSWEDMLSVLVAELGSDSTHFFASIERDPIASASLAQVHVAIGVDGKKYAIKIQHPGLEDGCKGDRIAITYVIDMLSKVFPQFNYNWLTREMNRNLPQELDFRVEVANIKHSSACLKDLIASGNVAFPEVVDRLCSSRVLTMSFESG